MVRRDRHQDLRAGEAVSQEQGGDNQRHHERCGNGPLHVFDFIITFVEISSSLRGVYLFLLVGGALLH
jgi:hypothetical protein